MIMARLSKAVLASGNVVALPTAAPRKVVNSRFAEQRQASLAARKNGLFSGRYQHHQEREANRLAAELSAISQTPELLIVSAILRSLEPALIGKILEQLAPGVVAGSAAHRQAVATVQASNLNLGQQFDLMRAFARLRGEDD
ncbi:hypothetical protein [Sphingomonas sp. Sph1(2015)]|jgi:hypothetical protein|uniref:hypothetical protein n=1 Tax=Sphingomonas sp. Sph1(2015) TaxID=1628084 RepID=UPI0011157D86|nr:hypothetical protein [Sphingomonas sp. Sph1(2015)]